MYSQERNFRDGRSALRRLTSIALGAGFLAVLVIAPAVTTDWLASPYRWIDFLCYATTIQFALQLVSWKLVSGTLFDPYAVFLTAATMFNAGRALMATLPGASFESRFQAPIALHALYLVALSLCALHLGGLIALSRPHVRPTPQSSMLAAVRPHTLRSVGALFILVAIVPMSIVMRGTLSGVMQEGYEQAVYAHEMATSFAATPSVLAAFLLPGVFLLLSGSAKKRGPRLISLVVIGLYTGTLLFIGSRSTALTVAIGYAWLWHRCVWPIPRIAGVALGASLLVILPAVAAMRNLTGQDRLSPVIFAQSVRSAGVFAAVGETGMTWDTVAHTVNLVPSERPYDYGASYGLSALTVFPNLFWTVHPALANGSPALWLVRRVAPWSAVKGGGLGYSFIAEAYLNFGTVGCVFVAAILGFMLARAVRWADAVRYPLGFALVAASLSTCLKYVRADSTELVRPLVWYAILPCLLVLLVSKRRKSYPSTTAPCNDWGSRVGGPAAARDVGGARHGSHRT